MNIAQFGQISRDMAICWLCKAAMASSLAPYREGVGKAQRGSIGLVDTQRRAIPELGRWLVAQALHKRLTVAKETPSLVAVAD